MNNDVYKLLSGKEMASPNATVQSTEEAREAGDSVVATPKRIISSSKLDMEEDQVRMNSSDSDHSIEEVPTQSEVQVKGAETRREPAPTQNPRGSSSDSEDSIEEIPTEEFVAEKPKVMEVQEQPKEIKKPEAKEQPKQPPKPQLQLKAPQVDELQEAVPKQQTGKVNSLRKETLQRLAVKNSSIQQAPVKKKTEEEPKGSGLPPIGASRSIPKQWRPVEDTEDDIEDIPEIPTNTEQKRVVDMDELKVEGKPVPVFPGALKKESQKLKSDENQQHAEKEPEKVVLAKEENTEDRLEGKKTAPDKKPTTKEESEEDSEEEEEDDENKLRPLDAMIGGSEWTGIYISPEVR